MPGWNTSIRVACSQTQATVALQQSTAITINWPGPKWTSAYFISLVKDCCRSYWCKCEKRPTFFCANVRCGTFSFASFFAIFFCSFSSSAWTLDITRISPRDAWKWHQNVLIKLLKVLLQCIILSCLQFSPSVPPFALPASWLLTFCQSLSFLHTQKMKNCSQNSYQQQILPVRYFTDVTKQSKYKKSYLFSSSLSLQFSLGFGWFIGSSRFIASILGSLWFFRGCLATRRLAFCSTLGFLWKLI